MADPKNIQHMQLSLGGDTVTVSLYRDNNKVQITMSRKSEGTEIFCRTEEFELQTTNQTQKISFVCEESCHQNETTGTLCVRFYSGIIRIAKVDITKKGENVRYLKIHGNGDVRKVVMSEDVARQAAQAGLAPQPPTPITDIFDDISGWLSWLYNIITNNWRTLLFLILYLDLGFEFVKINDNIAQLQQDINRVYSISQRHYAEVENHLCNLPHTVPTTMEQIQSVLLPIVSSPLMQYVFALCTLLAFTATIFCLFDRCISHNKPAIKNRRK